jgi:hypothetical protein
LSIPLHMVYLPSMDYYLLWVFIVGLVAGVLPSAYLSYRLRMLEMDLAGFEQRFISEQKRKAVRARWDQQTELDELMKIAPPQSTAKKSPLLKFGIGPKSA